MSGGRTVTERFDGRKKMHEVWNKLDKVLDQLKIRQQGHRVDSHEAYSIVEFWNGDPMKRLAFDWINGVIQDDDFFDQAIMFINRFADGNDLKRPEV